MHARWLLAAVALAACRHQEPGPVCISTSSSTLAGVDLEFPHQPCELSIAQAAAGFDVAYVVHVDQAVEQVRPEPLDAGWCEQPGTSGLILHAELGDDAHTYCECDVGLCPPVDRPRVTLSPGDYPGSVHLEAHDWMGPSDTGVGPGADFPAGAYDVVLTARGVVGTSLQARGYIVEGRLGMRFGP